MATEPYRPSNGTEGEFFQSHFCDRCNRDAPFRADPGKGQGCPILCRVLAFSIDDPKYPKEWVRDVDCEVGTIGGKGARCTAFEPDDLTPPEPSLDSNAVIHDLFVGYKVADG